MRPAHRSAQPPQPESPVRDDRHATRSPHAVHRGHQVDPRRGEQGDAIARAEAERGEPPSDPGDGGVQLGERGGRTRHPVDERRRGVGPPLLERRPGGRERLAGRVGDPLRRRTGRRLQTGSEPRIDGGGDVGLLRRQMSDPRVPLTVGVGQPGGEVERERVVEHRIGGAPRQQRRDRHRREPIGHDGESRRRRVGVVERHVGHELGDGPAIGGRPIGRPVRLARLPRETRPREAQGAVDERAGPAPDEVGDRAGGGQPDQPRCRSARRHRDPGVDQDHADEFVESAHCPSHDDGTAPVVTHQDHGSGDPEGLHHVAEITDPRGVGTQCRPFGIAHAELIDRDHAIPIARRREHTAPQVRPGRVAVHADDRRSRCLGRALEHVPAPTGAVVPHHVDEAGPRRVDSPAAPLRMGRRRRGRHHTISVKLVFSPDPMPMHNTRSPALNSSWTPARVMGMAAGPTLPSFG